MSKHTQEEWRAEPDGDHLMVCTDLLEICTIQPVDRGGVKQFYLGDETIANTRLIAAAPDLLEALEACLDALWEDTREVQLDGTMMFGHGYDWDGWESYRWELHTRQGSFAIWPAHGTYSAYGGLYGSYWNQCFASASEAKAAIVKYVSKIEPEHPASKAYAAIAKARGE